MLGMEPRAPDILQASTLPQGLTSPIVANLRTQSSVVPVVPVLSVSFLLEIKNHITFSIFFFHFVIYYVCAMHVLAMAHVWNSEQLAGVECLLTTMCVSW